MKKIIILLFILVNTAAFGKIHYGIYVPGQAMWMPPEISFNEHFKVPYGDTVAVPAGNYPESNIYKAEGITFMNVGGVATFKYFSLYNSTKDIRILGNGVPGIEYGIVFSSTTNFGSLCETTGYLVFRNVKVSGSTLGIQVGHHPSKTYAAPALNLTVENCLIENVGMEAFYFGHDALGGPYITGIVRNNIVRNTGRDGIQCRNGVYTIENNSVENAGLNGEEYHAHGILIGPGVGGSIVNNTVKNAKGYGCFINNRGKVVLKGNNFQSALASIFIKNYEQDYPYQTERFMMFEVSGNSLSSLNGKAMEVLFDPAKDPITVNFGVNTYTGQLAIQPGVTFLYPEVVPPPPPTKIILRTGYFTIDGKRKYYNIYSDFTWKYK